jgi:hypothetical protein
MTPNGKYAWRKRVDGQEEYLSADTPSELKQQVDEVIDLKITRSKLTVDELFTKWLNFIDGLRKKPTYNQYSSIYKKHSRGDDGSQHHE